MKHIMCRIAILLIVVSLSYIGVEISQLSSMWSLFMLVPVITLDVVLQGSWWNRCP